jgi:hypothetical protein
MNKLPIYFERLEGAVLFFAMLTLYVALHGHFWQFVLLILSIDLSILGYLAGPKFGAVTYNIAHIMVGPLICIALGLLNFRWFGLTLFGIIWLAHLGLDRALGLGLKYPDRFGHTTLGMIGKKL